MGQKGVTDSVLSLIDIPYAGIPEYGVGKMIPAVMFILACLFFFIFRTDVLSFFRSAFDFLKDPAGRRFVDSPVRQKSQTAVFFLLSLPVSVYVFCVSGYSALSCFQVSLSLILFFLAKSLILSAIAFVSGEKEGITLLLRLMFVSYILSTCLFFVLILLAIFLDFLSLPLFGYLFTGLSVLSGILYAVLLLRIIFTMKMSLLMSILYLCTLEILPVSLAVRTAILY